VLCLTSHLNACSSGDVCNSIYEKGQFQTPAQQALQEAPKRRPQMVCLDFRSPWLHLQDPAVPRTSKHAARLSDRHSRGGLRRDLFRRRMGHVAAFRAQRLMHPRRSLVLAIFAALGE